MNAQESDRRPGEDMTSSEREELLSRRLEDSAVRRIQSNFAIFGVVVALLAFAGIFGFAKYLEYSLAASISSSVSAVAEKEMRQVSEAVSKKVEVELGKVDRRLASAEEKVEEVDKKALRIELDTEQRLKNTVGRVEYMGQLLVDDVERRRREAVSELANEFEKFAVARKDTERQSTEILARIKGELGNLERLTTVVRASLKDKIAILRGLKIDGSVIDGDIQRYMAILVLREMEDPELVKRERVEEEAGQAVSELLAKESLRDDFYAEVRFRIMRVVSELHLLEIARKQVLERSAWERGNWILLLGAIGDPEGIPILVKIIRTRTEGVSLREAAVRSLGAIGRYSNIMGVALYSYLKWPRVKRFGHQREWEDSEIEAMRPRRGGLRLYGGKVSEELSRLSIETVTSVASAKNEPASIRKIALGALRRLADTDVVEVVGRVLLDEWENYGTEAINVLAEIPHDKSVAVLRRFALMTNVNASAQLMSVQALADMETQSAVAALREISEKSPDGNVRVAALESVKVLAEKIK